MLWILRPGAPWQDLPDRYPPYQTCHRRFQPWRQAGVIARRLRALAEDVRERGGVDLSECFLDGTFGIAQKGAAGVGPTKRGQRDEAPSRGRPRGSSCRRPRGQGCAV